MSDPDFTTFEGRQAYIDKCEAEIAAAIAKSERQRAEYELLNARIQAVWMQFNLEITTLIYRGMFDPTFCAPKREPRP